MEAFGIEERHVVMIVLFVSSFFPCCIILPRSSYDVCMFLSFLLGITCERVFCNIFMALLKYWSMQKVSVFDHSRLL